MKSNEIKLTKHTAEAILLDEICKKFNIKKEDIDTFGFKYSDEFVVSFSMFDKEEPEQEE